MTEYERSRTVEAQPEEVFARVADVGRTDTWLPHALHLRPDDPPAVTVHDDDTGQDAAALMRAEEDQMRLEWGTREDGRYAGWLQVSGIGSGASEVTVHLSFFDERHAPDRGHVGRALDESLDRLVEQVRTDGGGG